ncbi:MAG: pilin [bacterium]|nr:pilin [bacterium]
MSQFALSPAMATDTELSVIPQNEQGTPPKGITEAGGLLKDAGSRAGFKQTDEPEVVAGKIIQGALVIMGTIFGILVIYGGYLWMQARGNEEYVKKAKGILEAAIIGIVIVMGAYAITAFIVDRVITAAQFGQ